MKRSRTSSTGSSPRVCRGRRRSRWEDDHQFSDAMWRIIRGFTPSVQLLLGYNGSSTHGHRRIANGFCFWGITAQLTLRRPMTRGRASRIRIIIIIIITYWPLHSWWRVETLNRTELGSTETHTCRKSTDTWLHLVAYFRGLSELSDTSECR